MMMPKQLILSFLLCSLAFLGSCKEDDPYPLRFYQDSYEVPMNGIRYVGLESGNGDYSVEIGNPQVAIAGVQKGWSATGGSLIYVQGVLTGNTQLKVTDNVTLESKVLNIKVVDSYECLRIGTVKDPEAPQGQERLLEGIDYIFLVNNTAERKAYFFKQGVQTMLSSGLDLVGEGKYTLEREDNPEDENALLKLYYSNDAAQAMEQSFTLYGNAYILHRLNKNLNLGWNTKPVDETRTSVTFPSSYPGLLEEVTADGGKGRKVSFSFEHLEMPEGILP